MSNIILGYNNVVADAVLTSTGQTWETNLPITNLQSDKLAELAQTTSTPDLTGSKKLTATFATGQTVGCIALVNHNLSADITATFVVNGTPSDSISVVSYVDADRTPYLVAWADENSLLTTSVTVSIDNPTITAGAFRIGTPYIIVIPGTPSFMAIGAANNNVGTIFTATGVGSGTGTCKQAYFSFGRLFIGKQFEPAVNVEYGNAGHGKIDLSTSIKTVNGVKWHRERAKLRHAAIGLNGLTQAEMLAMDDLMQHDGTTRDIIYGFNRPTYTANVPDELSYKRTFIGNLTSLDALNSPFFERYSWQFALEELAI